jgi:competence protein ComEA
VNLSAKKNGLILVAAAAIVLLIILLWRYTQGGDRASQMGFTPVNEQMQQLIEETAEHSASTNTGASQQGSKPSSKPNIVKGSDHEGLSSSSASSSPNEITDSPTKGLATPAITKKSGAAINEAIKTSPHPSSLPKAASENSGRIDLNTATLEQLDTLPGIGESKAKAILVYRKEKGSFKKVEDLLEVKGIGDKVLAKIKPMVYAAQP